MARELKFDIQKLEEMKKKFVDVASELEQLKNEATSSIKELKKFWDTPAGKKHLKDVNTDWADEIVKYIEIVNAVSELIDEAIKAFSVVEDKLENYNF